ncbi:sugar efflux transporter [Neiella marina]|uniref:Sugar efflux transporter n=1 Tax=Neiella holothuriorum TaxID=2870530 RepID=A0ABS7EGZ5_9GAMM|nr:sugar efflux transporter [Neiella holothuriorum]MBW8191593.1 sugar efflux transporter [Neiella holothuriorum]
MKRFINFNGDAGRLFALNGLTAMSYSLIMPIMSIFLIQHLQAPPSYIGIYTVSTALSGVVFSQLLGTMLDRGKSGLWLFLAAMTSALIAAIAFAQVQTFWQALVIGVVLMGFASAAFPLLLAMIRNYADHSGKNSLALNSQMRSGVSLVWIVGPTMAFTAVDWLGFSANFYLSGAISLSVILLACVALPNLKMVKPPEGNKQPTKPIPMQLWLLGAVMLLGNLANSLYLTAMPLYLTQELHLPLALPGMLMGLTAALEIPFMLLVPRWAGRFGRHHMLNAGFVVALAFYLLLQVADSQIELILLQLLNGIFFGIFAGLGISVIQDASTERLGFASAFYTNAMRTGMMAGTALAGLLAQFWSFKLALFGAAVATVFAMVMMLVLRWFTPKEGDTAPV